MIVSILTIALACLAQAVYGAEPVSDFYRLESYPHSLTKPFLDKYLSSRFYDYGGNTLIKSDSFIRLTGDRPAESGWLFSKLPALPENFQVEFDFKIHGSGSMYGDGMAFWVTTHKGGTGPVFGSRDNFEGLGIFFDTYKNNRPGKSFPLVMAMMGDGKTSYDHQHDGLANEIASCTARGLYDANDISKARVTYVKGKFLSLDLDYKGHNKWTNCFMLTENIDLPQGAFLGFSARTGQLHENHDLHRVQVYSLRNPPSNYGQLLELDAGLRPTKDFGNPYRTTTDIANEKQKQLLVKQREQELKENQKGTWMGFLFKIFIVIVVILLAIVAYGIYITKNKRTRRHEMDYYL